MYLRFVGKRMGRVAILPPMTWIGKRIGFNKSKGGTFETFTDKGLSPLTAQQLVKHLEGKRTICI